MLVKEKNILITCLCLLSLLTACDKASTTTPNPQSTVTSAFATLLVTPTPTVTPPPTPTPLVLDQSDPNSVLRWVTHAIDVGEASLLADLVHPEYFYYVDLINGTGCFGPDGNPLPITLDAIQERLQVPPVCKGVIVDSSYQIIMIWYSGWQPAWDMCSEIVEPPDTGIFLIGPEESEYFISFLLVGALEVDFDEFAGQGDEELMLLPCDAVLDYQSDGPRCPGSPPQRMEIGKSGYVCTSEDSLRLRQTPGTSGTRITSLPAGTSFVVIDGPECAGNNWSWWKIRLSDGSEGWVAEGGDEIDRYYLCPAD